MKKILFISHDAHLAGAQILLLNLLKWMQDYHPNIQFDILLADGGVLVSQFKKLSKVYHLPKSNNKENYLERILFKVRQKKFFEDLKKNGYDLIYNNTFSNGVLLSKLKTSNVSVITHVHELHYWITKNGLNNQNHIKKHTDYFLTASKSVKKYLLSNEIGDEKNIEEVYVFVDTQQLNDGKKNSIKEFLNLPIDSIIIAASGRENFRKGKDWFIPIAIEVLTTINDEKIHFVWIGGHTTEELLFDCVKSGFQNNIHFIEHIPEANTYFNEFEIFLMLSREDPFPLVNLEAAIWEVPVICFENTGGTEELISDNCGIKVPYGNLNLFSKAIVKLLENKELKKEIGRNIKSKVLKEYDINVIGERIVSAIQKIVNSHE